MTAPTSGAVQRLRTRRATGGMYQSGSAPPPRTNGPLKGTASSGRGSSGSAWSANAVNSSSVSGASRCDSSVDTGWRLPSAIARAGATSESWPDGIPAIVVLRENLLCNAFAEATASDPTGSLRERAGSVAGRYCGGPEDSCTVAVCV